MDVVFQIVINSLIAASIYAILALGFNLIYGTAKFLEISFGAVAVSSVGIVLWASRSLELHIFFSVLLGVLSAGFLGWVIYFFIYKKLKEKKASNLVLLIASLGVFTALQALAVLVLHTLSLPTIISLSSKSATVFNFFGASVTNIQIVIFFSALIIAGILIWIMKTTKLGKAIRAIGDDEEVSKMVGIDTYKVTGIVFFIGMAIAGLAGILVSFDTSVNIQVTGFSLLLKGVIASIIGGIGNIYGSLAGALILGFVENFGIWKLPAEWKDAIAFGLLILFLVFKPKGLFPK